MCPCMRACMYVCQCPVRMHHLPPPGTFVRLPLAQRTRKHINTFRNNIDQILQAARTQGALRVTYVHKPTTDGPPAAQAVDVTTLPRANGQGMVEKATLVRTLIPRAFLLGRNSNLLCWCSDVTDYAGAGLVADEDLVHVKHFLVRNMSIVRLASKPPAHVGVTFDVTSTHVGRTAQQQPDQYM